MIDTPEEFKSIIDTVMTIAAADSYDALIDLMNNSDVTIGYSGDADPSNA